MKFLVVPVILALGGSTPRVASVVAAGRSGGERAPTIEPVEWTNMTGVASAPGRLTKTRETSAWDAGAVSTRAIVSPDGYMEFVASEPGRAVIGLSHGDDGPEPSDIDFGVRLSEGALAIVERGRLRRRGPLAEGDRIRVAVESGRIAYRRNGRLLYRSRIEPTFPLLVDTSIHDRTSLGGVVIAGVLQPVAAAPPSFDPRGMSSSSPLSVALMSDTDGARIHYDLVEGDPGPNRPWVLSGDAVSVERTAGLRARACVEGLFGSATRRAVYSVGGGPSTEPVEWTRLDGVEIVDGQLVKNRTTRAWDSGAVSTRGIISEDGYLDFTLVDRGELVAGLSRGDRDAADDDVDFGFLVSGGALSVFESGHVRAHVGAVRPGDRLRVALEAGVLRYLRNGALLYESVAVPDYPLLVDTSIHHRASIGDAVISGVLVDLALPDPSADPFGGRYFTPQDVVLTSEPDTSIHYSIGGELDANSPLVPSGGAVHIDRSATVRAQAQRDGWLPSAVTEAAYELVTTAPVPSPPPGAYGSPLVVALATATPNAEIRYTTDGTEPSELSALYSGPIAVPVTTTLRARAFRAGWTPSGGLSARYEVLAGQVAAPVFDPPGGTYLGARDVRFSTATPGASIRYTTDGSEPTDGSPTLEAGGVLRIAATTTLKAVASKTGLLASGVTAARYVILDDIGPVLDPPGGTFTRSVRVRVTCPASEIVVHYRMDGEVPTQTDPAVACGGTITVDRSVTLTALAFLGEQTGEPVVATYRIADAVAAGPTHLLLLRRDGTVWAWGENDAGQLGDGSHEPAPEPKPSLVSGAIQVAAGGRHSLAVKENGSVVAWGDGALGQLGTGVRTSSSQPVLVSGLTEVTAIAAGESHNLALRADGTVWAWGDNDQGQLGIGTTDASAVPVLVADLSDVVEIAAGRRHSLARRNDGSTWAWGANDVGQLGVGTSGPGLRPMPVPGLPAIRSIAAGDEHSLAVAEDGALWGWGTLDPAQLDPLTTVPVLSPTLLGTTSCDDSVLFTPLADARLAEGGSGRSVVAGEAAVFAWAVLADWGSCRATELRSLVDGEFVRLSAAGRRYLGVTADGTVWYWEDDEAGLSAPYPVTVATGELRVSPPTISVRSGSYHTELDVMLTAPTAGSVIRYTTDGAEPDEASPVVASGASIRIERSTALQAIAVKADRPASVIRRADYVLKVLPPVLTPPPGAFDGPVDVTLSVATAGAMLRVRTGGGLPQPGDPELPSGTTVRIAPPDQLQVEAFREGWESTSAGGVYRLGVVTPVISPPGGVFEGPVTVTIRTTTPGAILRYAWDLGDPALGAPIVSGGSLRVDRTATLRVIGFLRDNDGASDVATASFRFALKAPTLHVARPLGPEGPFYVTGATAVSGAIVRCTVDGSEPHVRSPICNLPIPVDTTATVKARAFVAGWDPSPVAERTVAVTGPVVRTPVLSLEGGRYPSRRTVRIEAPTAGSTIHYTTNGADPTESDPVVGSGDALVVDRSLILKARAFLGGAASLIARADYLLTGAVRGDATVLALKTDGTVWGWGDNNQGLVGNGTTSFLPVTRPERVAIDAVVSLAVGRDYAVALREDGSVWTWGSNIYGQRGLEPTTTGPEPTPLTGVVDVAAGGHFGAALKSDHSLWVWGGSSEPGAYVPREVPDVRCRALLAEGDRIACIEASGEILLVFVNGMFEPAPELRGLLELSEGGVALVGRGDRRGLLTGGGVSRFDLPPAHLAARNLLVTDRGTAWTTGDYSFTSTGASSVVAEASPAVVIAASSAADASGVLWRWGANAAGQLGDGTTGDRLEPGEVPGLRLFSDSWFGEDADADGLDNLAEYYLGTDPLNPDTNGDGVSDGASVAIGRDPVSVDLDGDGLGNREELRVGTGVLNPDSDGDGVVDGQDAYPLDSSRSEPPPPDTGDTTAPVILLREPRNAVLVSSIP